MAKSRLGVKAGMGSMTRPRARLRTPQMSNCPTEKDMDSKLWAYLPRMTT